MSDLDFHIRPIGVVKPEPFGGYDFAKKSLAVLALGPHGTGCIMWQVGGHLAVNYEETQSCELGDNGLDGWTDSRGIFVWEGVYRSYGPTADGEYDAELDGDIREPSSAEWEAIRAGRCPWNDDDWKLPRG